jgi:hypothetical protein
MRPTAPAGAPSGKLRSCREGPPSPLWPNVPAQGVRVPAMPGRAEIDLPPSLSRCVARLRLPGSGLSVAALMPRSVHCPGVAATPWELPFLRPYGTGPSAHSCHPRSGVVRWLGTHLVWSEDVSHRDLGVAHECEHGDVEPGDVTGRDRDRLLGEWRRAAARGRARHSGRSHMVAAAGYRTWNLMSACTPWTGTVEEPAATHQLTT